MRRQPTALTLRDLAHNGSWMRALAARLVRDDAAADDLVQETWLAALQRRPSRERSLRPWLARVARNLAAKRHSREVLRRTTELGDVARESASPEEAAEALEQQKLLVQLVQGLAEPQRSTLVLRYVNGLSSAEIARRQGVPPGTVRWRVKEAMDRLRVELDARNGGDRQRWTRALVALLRGEEPLARVARVGALPVVAVIGISVALAAFGARSLLGVSISPTGGEEMASAAEQANGVDAPAAEEPSAREASPPREVLAPGPATVSTQSEIAANLEEDVPASLAGTLRDQDGEALGPATLMLRMEDDRVELVIRVGDDGRWSLTDVAPGRYTIGAETLPAGYLPAWNQWSPRVSRTVRLEERFQVGPVPSPDYGATVVEVESGSALMGVDLTVYLAAEVNGRVVDRDDSPVVDAWILLKGFDNGYSNMRQDARTDGHGEFRVRGLWPGSYEVTVYADRQVGRTALTQSSLPVIGVFAGSSEWIEVRLGSGSCAVRGRVLDDEGLPFAGLQILCYRKPGNWGDRVGCVVTDGSGRFELAGMEPGTFGWNVGHGAFSLSARLGENEIARWVGAPGFEIVENGDVVELEDIVAIRSKPFVLNGRVVPTDEGMRPRDVSLELRWSAAAQFDPDQRMSPKSQRVSVEDDGSFTWWCETPHPNVELHVSRRRGSGPSRVIPITPERGAERELIVEYE